MAKWTLECHDEVAQRTRLIMTSVNNQKSTENSLRNLNAAKANLETLRSTARQTNQEYQDLLAEQQRKTQALLTSTSRLGPVLKTLQNSQPAMEIHEVIRNNQFFRSSDYAAASERVVDHVFQGQLRQTSDALFNADKRADEAQKELRETKRQLKDVQSELARLKQGPSPALLQHKLHIDNSCSMGKDCPNAKELARMHSQQADELARARIDAVGEYQMEQNALLSFSNVFESLPHTPGIAPLADQPAPSLDAPETRSRAREPHASTHFGFNTEALRPAPSPLISRDMTGHRMPAVSSAQDEIVVMMKRLNSAEVAPSQDEEENFDDEDDNVFSQNIRLARQKQQDGIGALSGADKRPGSSGIMAQQPPATRHKPDNLKLAQAPKKIPLGLSAGSSPNKQQTAAVPSPRGYTGAKRGPKPARPRPPIIEKNPLDLPICVLVDGEIIDLAQVKPYAPELSQDLENEVRRLLVGYQDQVRRRHYTWIDGENSSWCYRAHVVSFNQPSKWPENLIREAACSTCDKRAIPCIIHQDGKLVLLPRRTNAEDNVDYKNLTTWVKEAKDTRKKPRKSNAAVENDVNASL